MPGIHPGIHIVVTEEFDRFTQRRGGQQNRRPDEISRSEPRVREISPRPRPVRTDPNHGLDAIPGALEKISRPVYNGLAAVAVLLHRRAPGHHLPRLHERIRRDPLHRGQLYPIQQPINRIRARRSRCGESLYHLRVTPQQLVVAVHYLLMIPPRIPILRQRGGTKRSGVLHVSWTVTKNRFNRTCEVKSVSCPHQRFSEEFKQQVVLEVIEKPLHDQRCGKVLRSGPANRGKLGE